MAAYAETTSLKGKIHGKPGDSDVAFFNVNITNYNSTLAAITEITREFETNGIKAVVASSMTDGGVCMLWVAASNAFKCWYFDYNDTGDDEAIELADDIDAGACDVMVIGTLKN